MDFVYKTALREEYLKEFEYLKKYYPEEYLWKTSNTKYIKWLEEKVKNPHTTYVYVLYYSDIFNILDKPKIKVHKTREGAERMVKRLLENHPEYEGMWEIREEKTRP